MSKQKALEEKKAAKKQSTSAKATKETVQLDLPIENSSEKLERLKQKKDRVSARAKALDEEIKQAEAEKEAAEKEAKVKASAEVEATATAIYNGPGYAYKYWDYKTQTYGIKSDIWAAKAAGCGVYTPIWVWYKDGKIDHLLDSDEIARYTP